MNNAEIIKGIDEEDQIVIKGHDWLRNRSKVKVMK